jgi:hypothetical protein
MREPWKTLTVSYLFISRYVSSGTKPGAFWTICSIWAEAGRPKRRPPARRAAHHMAIFLMRKREVATK